MKTLTAEQFKAKYGEAGVASFTQPPQTQGVLERVGQSFTARRADVQSAKERSATGEQTGAETFGQTLGQGIGMVTDLVAEAPGVKQVLGGIGTGFKALSETSPIKWLADVSPDVGGAIMKYSDSLSPREKANFEAAMNIASVVPIGKAGELIGRGAKAGFEATAPIVRASVESAVDLSKRATSKIIQITEPKPLSPTKAVDQVLQGDKIDVVSGVKGLSTLDTTGVKTYTDLSGKIDKKISELAKQVDDDLGTDTTKRPMKDLIITGKTTSGKIVKTTPVNDALNQLDELYTKTGDKLASANIKELIQRAKKDGITNLEINDIARVYGSEFKSKAFSKKGDPLTSVNAQMYENTRKAVKELARRGVKGKEAQIADKQMTALYNIKTLVNKNVEAVHDVQKKIQERGLFEKAGHVVTKYGDILTGGTLRGIVGGLLPRGAGYKLLNALDIQDTLGKNLQIIQKAINSKSDAEIIKILQGLPQSSALKATTPKITTQTTTNIPAKTGATAQSIKNSIKGTIPSTVPRAVKK